MSRRPLYRVEPALRHVTAEALVGQRVRLVIVGQRRADAERFTYVGKLVAVAHSMANGTTSSAAVLVDDKGVAGWAPLATVESIELATDGGTVER